mgnify:CR=1 FL=1
MSNPVASGRESGPMPHDHSLDSFRSDATATAQQTVPNSSSHALQPLLPASASQWSTVDNTPPANTQRTYGSSTAASDIEEDGVFEIGSPASVALRASDQAKLAQQVPEDPLPAAARLPVSLSDVQFEAKHSFDRIVDMLRQHDLLLQVRLQDALMEVERHRNAADQSQQQQPNVGNWVNSQQWPQLRQHLLARQLLVDDLANPATTSTVTPSFSSNLSLTNGIGSMPSTDSAAASSALDVSSGPLHGLQEAAHFFGKPRATIVVRVCTVAFIIFVSSSVHTWMAASLSSSRVCAACDSPWRST